MGKLRVRTLKRLNQSIQNLARVLTSAVSIQIDRRAITGLGLTVSKSTVTDLRPVCTDVRTVAVDERSEVSFSIPPGTLPWQPILGGRQNRRGINAFAQLIEVFY